MRVATALLLALLPSGAASAQLDPIPAGPGHNGLVAMVPSPLSQRTGPCVLPAHREQAARLAEVARVRLGLPSATHAAGDGSLTPFPFLPMGGTRYRDLFIGSFVDLDPTPGELDFQCGAFTRDTHAGLDYAMRSFGEQALGMPVFAALDGTVLVAVDGFDDMNLNGSLDTGNFVVIDHGGGFETSYWHMAKNSVAVSVGEDVSAGTQVGRAGSSGNSFGPHLHFETQEALVPVEPHVGSCNAAPSATWETEPVFSLDAYVWDFGASRTDAFASPLTIFPHEPIKDAQHALSDSHVYFWIRMSNLPAGSDWDVNWYQPNGQLVWDGFVVPFGNAELFVEYWTGWAYDFPELHTIAGTWRLELLINGEVVVDVPIEIVATIDPAFNRPPEPITVDLDPPEPVDGDTVFARVTTDLLEDDLDWDIVRFRYEWDVQGTTVRDVTTAAHSDAIPRDAALPGERITCTVTPSDGKVGGTGAPVSTSAVLQPSPWTDLGFALGGTLGDPALEATGSLVPGLPVELAMTNVPPSTGMVLFAGLSELNFSPFYGGTLVPDPNPPGLLLVLVSDGAGQLVLPGTWPAQLPPGFTVWLQYFFEDGGAPFGVAGSNAVRGVTQ